jgi:hypothetical protein
MNWFNFRQWRHQETKQVHRSIGDRYKYRSLPTHSVFSATLLLSITALFREQKAREDFQLDHYLPNIQRNIITQPLPTNGFIYISILQSARTDAYFVFFFLHFHHLGALLI